MLLAVLADGHVARAQVLTNYFPPVGTGAGGIPTDSSRARASEEYRPLGIQLGDFTIRPQVSQSLGYNSNVNSLGVGGSLFEDTNASVSVRSNWARNSVDAELTVSDTHYAKLPSQNATTWTATIGGTRDIGRDTAGLSYSHLSLVSLPYDLGASFSQPVPYSVDIVSGSYNLATTSAFSFLPAFDVSHYSFDAVPIYGFTNLDATYNNRLVAQEDLTSRYEFFPGNDALLVLRSTEIRFDNTVPGTPKLDSNGGSILAGFAYDGDGLFHYRALVGYQVRAYENALYGTRSAPIFELSVNWLPTRLDTVSLIFARDIEDASAEGLVGFTYTSGRLQIDHELQRNVLLEAYAQAQHADYLNLPTIGDVGLFGATHANETTYSFGGRATWRLDRNITVSASGGVYLTQGNGVALNNAGSVVGTTGALAGGGGLSVAASALLTVGFAF